MALTAYRLTDESGNLLTQEGGGYFIIEVAPASIAVTPGLADVLRGGTVQFTATATLPDSSTQDVTTSVTWSVSNSSLGSITQGGLYTASPVDGDNTITAEQDGVSGTAVASDPGRGAVLTQIVAEVISGHVAQRAKLSQIVLEFILPNVYTMVVSPQNAATILGVPVQYSAKKTNQSGQEKTVPVAWSLDDPTVGTIDAFGLFTPNTPGTHTITATEVGNS
jgi:hypothetical protein